MDNSKILSQMEELQDKISEIMEQLINQDVTSKTKVRGYSEGAKVRILSLECVKGIDDTVKVGDIGEIIYSGVEVHVKADKANPWKAKSWWFIHEHLELV